MSFFDDLKGKAEELAEGHEEQISGGLDKLGDLIDDKTNHEHSEHIDTGVDKAQDLLRDLADGDDQPKPG